MPKRKLEFNNKPNPSLKDFDKSRLFNAENSIYLFCIVVLACIVFWKTTQNGFTDWDDDLYVVKSDLIRRLDWSSFIAYFQTLTANLYTPLVTLSYAVDYHFFGLDPSGYHTTNLILHAINIVLVYVLTHRMFNRSFIAALTGLLFAIHPLNAEAVAWISSRKDLLFSMFYLLGLIAYLSYLNTKKIHQLVLVFVLFCCAVFSKPIAFTFPVVLVVLDYFKQGQLPRRAWLEKIPFLLISIAVGILGIYLVTQFEVFASAPVGYSVFDKICLAGYSLAYYLYDAFIPTGISNYHAYPFKEGLFLPAKYVVAPFLVVGLLFLVYKFMRVNFTLVAGLIMFIIIIGPTLRLIPTGYPIAADRYFYLASVGLFWSLILIGEVIAKRSFPLRIIVITLSLFFCVAFAIQSFNRVSDWKDSYSLWQSTLKDNPYHEIANEHLGKLYNNSGDVDRALIHFQRIIERNKTNYDVLNSAGNILVEKNRPDLALTYFDRAIATGNANHLPYYNRGMVYSSKNRFKEAITDFDASIALKTDFAEAYNNRGIAKVKSGDTIGAYVDFKEAVRLKPSDKMINDNFARIKLYYNP
jgi:tetratricopeptide (TPR) repeat protein